MRRRALKWLAFTSALLMMTLLVPSRSSAADDDDDPPSRAARLSFTSGAVSFSPAGTDDWVTPILNRPMTTGDKLWTDKNSRAELSLGSLYLRLSSETGFSFLNLDDNTTQVRITEGTISLRVRRLDEGEIVEVDTPNLAFNVSQPGSYKINVNEDGDATMIVVHDGAGDVTGGGASYSLASNQTGTFTGTDELSAAMDTLRGDDDFDQWCADRDRKYDRTPAARYVSDDVVGYEDLDDYGGWRSVPDYGTVWFPHTTVVGWVPYRYGHWVWVSPWGWTWVDDAPWGYAPFHYGRWVVVGGVWGWVPVQPRPRVVTVAYVRPVYAPALVAWVGGANWSVGVGVGPSVGWFPLGPRDVYCPSYRVSERYVERVNVYNTTIINRTVITNTYRDVYVNRNVTTVRYQNRTVSNAVTVTSRTTFVSSQSVNRNIVRVNERTVVSAGTAPFSPNVAPEQRSFLGAGAAARVQPPQRAVSRTVVARTAPPPAPVRYDRQAQAIQANGGRPISVREERQLTPQSEMARRNVRVVQANSRPVPIENAQQNRGPRPGVNQPQNQPQGNQSQANPPPVNQPQGNQSQANRPPVNQPQSNQPQVNPGQPRNNRPVYEQQGSLNPGSNPANSANTSNPPNRNSRNYGDRPPNSRPGQPNQPQPNPALRQKEQEQTERMRQQQDDERQKLEQRQIQEQQKAQQQRANDQRQDQMRQKQQQQLEQMEHRHDQQAQKLQQKQQSEERKQEARQPKQQQQQQPKPKPPKDNDHPH